MREIKFRAWDKVIGEILPNIQNHIGDFDTAFGNMLASSRENNDARWIIEQFTGDQDQEGNDFYEGDICEYQNYMMGDDIPDGFIGVIVFLECGFYVENESKKEAYPLFVEGSAWKRIGNIHANLELLKEEG